jgi:endonuclease/exonuclease/phosphatase family metal-dependent hydrolase
MRLLTYNIHKGIGGRDRQYRLQRIVDVIETENPDLICLQEVDRGVARSRHDDQPGLLAEAFKSAGHLFQPNVHLRAGVYGNLVLSRWSLRSKHQISLRLNKKKNRGAQLAIVETPEGLLHIVHVHLGLGERERHWQIEHLLGHHLFQEAAHFPTMIIGDSNDWRNTLCEGMLGLRGFRLWTAPISRFRTFPAWLPLGSLDKVFARGPFFVRQARVVHSKLARSASDHLPLVVDFHLDSGHASS